MKIHQNTVGLILIASSGLTTVALAQSTMPLSEPSVNTSYSAGQAQSLEYFNPVRGEREFTLSGTGSSNKDLDSSAGGVGLSLGQYLNQSWLFSVRQSVSYINAENAGSSWVGSTRAALDFHIPYGSRFRPFVGANLGGIYGGGVSDTFAAGFEAGVKYYVLPRTFIYAMGDYSWAFDESDEIDDQFDQGGFQWSLGMGFNF